MSCKTYSMECALESIIDYRGKTPRKSSTGIPTLSAKTVKNNFIDYSNCYYISKEEYARFMVRGFPRTGDVLLTTEAPMGMAARLDRDDVAIAQRLLTLRGKEGILDNDYLLYWLQSPIGQAALKAKESGTTVTGIKQAEFRKIKICLPEIGEQKKIGSILRAIDDKIAVNTKINNHLSDGLSAFYRQQFCASSEPDYYGCLADICQYSTEKIQVSQLNTDNYFSTENMLPGKAGALAASNLPNIKQTIRCRVGDTLISNIRPYFKKIIYNQVEGGCSTDVLCMVPKRSNLSAYIYCTLYADQFFDFMVAGSKGTKMPRGDKQQIMTYAVHFPTETELESFNAVAVPTLALINVHRDENIRLAALRDAILPRLMCGDIDISGIDL